MDVLKVGTFNFAVSMAISNPLEYCLKYGGSLTSSEKTLQAGCSAIKVSGGFTWVWAEHTCQSKRPYF